MYLKENEVMFADSFGDRNARVGINRRSKTGLVIRGSAELRSQCDSQLSEGALSSFKRYDETENINNPHYQMNHEGW